MHWWGGGVKAEIYNTSRFFLNKRGKKGVEPKNGRKNFQFLTSQGMNGKTKVPLGKPIVRCRDNSIEVNINYVNSSRALCQISQKNDSLVQTSPGVLMGVSSNGLTG